MIALLLNRSKLLLLVLLLLTQLPIVSTGSSAQRLAESEKTEETQCEARIVIAVAPVKRTSTKATYHFSKTRATLICPLFAHAQVVQGSSIPLFLKNRTLLI